MRFVLLLFAFVLALPTVVAQPITTGTLISEMADLDRLVRYPDPPCRVVQFSSYDRRSNLPGGPDWFANSDGFGNEPIPGFQEVIKKPGKDGVGEYLICDVRQPGAIVRTWTAAIEGKVRMYLDGSDTPVYDGSARDFLMHRFEHFAKAQGVDPKPALAVFQQRYADYFPIPFASRCRIVCIGKLSEVHFYQVQVRQYPAATTVKAFAPADLKTFADQIGAASQAMSARPAIPRPAGQPAPSEQTLAPGETKELLKLEGPAAIAQLDARMEASDLPAALRGTVLRIFFDGAQAPQVIAPLGDFFGAAPGLVPYETLPLSVRENGTLICRFVMPFAKSAVVTADNRSGAPIKVSVNAERAEHAWDGRSMHFHARWRADHDLFAKGGKDAVDLPFLIARGRGVYVGTAVYLMNPCPVPTAGGNWWGEGDEKIFVDDDKVPSIFGTGSEDYFNYAWSESDIFQYPYFSQPNCSGPETRGYITNNRWHILDAIPFDRSIAFFMELFSHAPTPHLSYCRTAYWYARPGSFDDGPPLDDSDLRVPALLPWTVRADGGARGATIFEAEDARDQSTPAQVVKDARYSNGQLVRFEKEPGKLKLKAPAAGKYNVVLTCVSGPQKNVFAARIDDTGLKHGESERIELHTPHAERLVNIWFQPVELTAGDHTLTLADFTSSLGVDFVWLKPAP